MLFKDLDSVEFCIRVSVRLIRVFLNMFYPVYSVLGNPAVRPGAMYMHSQQQGSFHHPHLQPTAAATAGIIRPVPQHAQPQASRVCALVSSPVDCNNLVLFSLCQSRYMDQATRGSHRSLSNNRWQQQLLQLHNN